MYVSFEVINQYANYVDTSVTMLNTDHPFKLSVYKNIK